MRAPDTFSTTFNDNAPLAADPNDDHHFVPMPRNLGGFPNLRCREIVKDIVEAINETLTACAPTDKEAHWFAIGMVRGARIVARQDGDTVAEKFVVGLLDVLNKRGVSAVRELVETVSG